MSTIHLILLAAALSASGVATAQNTYRWTDKNTGQTVYSDQQPPMGAKDVVIISGAAAGAETQMAPRCYPSWLADERYDCDGKQASRGWAWAVCIGSALCSMPSVAEHSDERLSCW